MAEDAVMLVRRFPRLPRKENKFIVSNINPPKWQISSASATSKIRVYNDYLSLYTPANLSPENKATLQSKQSSISIPINQTPFYKQPREKTI